MSNQTQVVKRGDNESLEALLQRPGYQQRFKEVLLNRAPQFMSSILSLGRDMPDVDPKSIVGSCMKAATLDLPIEKGLGFAWIIPYRDGNARYAQFQMGYKGYIQLALRTGRYERMSARPINQEALNGYDQVGEPNIDWGKVDETKEAVGYAFCFKLVGGFTKVCYWSKKKVLAHAQKYSQAYRKGGDTPWKTEFDKMALKTVIANELSDWGILSVEWQTAKKLDQGVVRDVDAEVEYFDTSPPQVEDRRPEPTAHQQATQTTQTAPPATATEKPAEKNKEPTKETKKQAAETKPKAQKPAKETPKTPESAPEAPQTPSAPQTSHQTPATEAQPPKSEPVPSETQTPEQLAAAEEAAEAAAGLAPAQELANGPLSDPKLEPQSGDTDNILSIKAILKKNSIAFQLFRGFLESFKLMGQQHKDLRDLATARLTSINGNLEKWLTDGTWQKWVEKSKA